MKRFLQIVCISSFLFACNVSKKITLGEELVSYKAAGNDVAAIHLGIYDKHSFVFELQPFSFETEATEKPIREVGTYVEEGDWYVLQFPKKMPFELQDLFDQELDGTEEYQILDARKIKIRKNLHHFYVWGILLEKQ